MPFPPQRKRAADKEQNAQRGASKKTKQKDKPVSEDLSEDEVSAHFVYAY